MSATHSPVRAASWTVEQIFRLYARAAPRIYQFKGKSLIWDFALFSLILAYDEFQPVSKKKIKYLLRKAEGRRKFTASALDTAQLWKRSLGCEKWCFNGRVFASGDFTEIFIIQHDTMTPMTCTIRFPWITWLLEFWIAQNWSQNFTSVDYEQHSVLALNGG